MPERMQNSVEWECKFVRGLPGAYKCLWFWLKQCACDHAGIWEVDFELAAMRTGAMRFKEDGTPEILINEQDALKHFDGKVLALDCGEKWFIMDFVSEQQKTTTLNYANTYHRGIINILAKYGLIAKDFSILREQNKGLIKPLESILKDAKVKVIVKVKDKFLESSELEKTPEPEISEHEQPKPPKAKNVPNDTVKTFETPLVKAFRDFKEMRVKKRAPLTPRAAELIHMELKKLAGDDELLKIAILEQSTLSSWSDVFPLKDKSKYNSQKAAASKTENVINIATAATFKEQQEA